MRRGLGVVVLLLLLAGCGAGGEGAMLDGPALMQEKNCVACHTISGARSVGPTWRGVAGSTVELVGGVSVVADTDYLRRSIVDPQAELVDGFTTVEMPTLEVTDEEVERLVAYIETLGGPAGLG